MNMTKKHAKRGSENDNTLSIRYLSLGKRVPVASKEVPVASRRVGVASKVVRVASERVPIGSKFALELPPAWADFHPRLSILALLFGILCTTLLHFRICYAKQT